MGDPLLVASNGAPGMVKAIETCFPRSARQRCLARRLRNLAAKVPNDRWPDFKARALAAYKRRAERSRASSPPTSRPTTRTSWPPP